MRANQGLEESKQRGGKYEETKTSITEVGRNR